jgi:hypothetical protein
MNRPIVVAERVARTLAEWLPKQHSLHERIGCSIRFSIRKVHVLKTREYTGAISTNGMPPERDGNRLLKCPFTSQSRCETTRRI